MSADRIARDYRIDFWRGFALLTIFVNHVPGNVFEAFTTRNFGFSDAAELFVFLAGYAAALAYFRKFEPGAQLLTTAKIWTRGAKIYIAHTVTVAIAIAIFCYAAVTMDDPEYLTWHGIGRLLSDPVSTLVGLAALTHQIGYFNILPMYIVFLAMLPGLIWLARRDLLLVLAASGGLWFIAHAAGLTIMNWPGKGGWFFNPFGWQFLFTIGLVCGILTLGRGGVPYSRRVYTAAASYVLLALVWRLSGFSIADYNVPLPQIMIDFGKTDLALPRLLHILALAYVVAYSPLSHWMREKLTGDNPVVLIGRHSLVIFCVGSLLAAIGQVFRYASGDSIAIDLLFIPAGIALHLAFAKVLEWYRLGTTRPAAARAATAEKPEPATA